MNLNGAENSAPFCYLLYLSTTLCIAFPLVSMSYPTGCGCPVDTSAKQKHRPRRQPRTPSRIRIVLLISFGITTRPRSSILLTLPLAVPDSVHTPIVAQSSTAALPYARCISHCERSRRHLLLSYIHFSLNYKLCCILRANASNKVHSGVKFSKFGNAVWFLLSVF